MNAKELQKDEILITWWAYPRVFTEINKLLKPHGLKIKHRGCYSRWGDMVAVKIEPLK